MDGLLFYWIAWMFWIYATFLMKKDYKRTWLAIWILVLLIFSDSIVMLVGAQINVDIFILYISAIVFLTRLDHWLINIFRSLCLSFGYVGILFWEQISPIWMFAPRVMLIGFLGFILLFILSNSFKERCAIWCLGITSGELIHGFIMNGYGFLEQIGDRQFLDLLFIELALLAVFEVFRELKARIDITVQTIEKQKKKVDT